MHKFTKTCYVDIETGECFTYEQIKSLIFKRLRKEVQHETTLENTLTHTTIFIQFSKVQQQSLF